METYRLKNIAILILLLLNSFLLVLLGWQFLRSRLAVDAAEQLAQLYAAKGLTLVEELDLSQPPLPPLTLSHRDESERSIAACLLGGDPVSASQGGGIVSYATEYGSIQFRSGGSFDGGSLDRAVEDPAAFAEDFCAQFGYAEVQLSGQDGGLRVTARQQTEGVPIAGCEVTLQFDGSRLTAVTGAHIDPEDAAGEAAERMDCVTALVRFLDYRESAGILCSAVTDVTCVYALQGGGTALRLMPVWQVETDTYTYFVDCASGEITRR